MAESEEIKKINLGVIHSSYILKGILSFLNKKQLLNMITYNKDLQNYYYVNIEDFKTISGKYKVGEKNGKGREYILNTNLLIYEGEYLKGERNGKGKEYNKKYYGELEYEGEYLRGKRNGKGKEYYDKGKVEFEGEYLNGKKWNG